MAGTVEVRGFMGLAKLFKERNWSSPIMLEVANPISGQELLAELKIPENEVEIIFVNGKVFLPANAIINPGDRVALLPPGTPGPYRVLLGFKNKT